MITGGGGDPIEAENVSYDNTTSGLTAVDVQSAIDELASAPAPSQDYDFDFSAFGGTATVTSSAGTIRAVNTDIAYMLNADKSIGKIYGAVQIDNVAISEGWTTVATIASSDFASITDAYNINIGFSNAIIAGSLSVRLTRLHFNTNGSIDIQVQAGASGTDNNIYVSLPACIYFLKDMGD